MASGILSRVNITSSSNTSIYTVPASKISSFTISAVNRNAGTDAQVKLALSNSSSPLESDFIEYNIVIPAYGTYERTGLVANASTIVVATSTAANLSFIVYGYEETAT